MKKVLLAMSGGTDSSVAAILLAQHYALEGITFRAYDTISKGCFEKETGCCSVDSIFEAKRLAESLGFEHEILDVRQEFADTVISNFISEYLEGKTPNPCVLCNTVIKWGKLIDEADRLGCDYLATGHYAQVIFENNRFFLRKGVDISKDQSYFLWTLTQENLSRTIFPLGGFTKDEVREIARKKKYEKIANKKESQEICFIPSDDYRQFLRDSVPNIDKSVGEGNFVNSDGKVIGKHNGYPYYTIGQRRGLGIALGYPAYVVSIDAKTNTICVGRREDLLESTAWIKDVNFMKYAEVPESLDCICKIRYNNQGEKCKISQHGNFVKIDFFEPVSAITSGQSAVIYENDDIVCGGVIFNPLSED